MQDPVALSTRYDYADAFAVDLPRPDITPPERWLGAALGQLPPVVRWITARLGFAAADRSSLAGWEVRTNGPAVIHLVAHLPLLHVDLVGRNISSTHRTLTTVLTYRRPWLARPVWLVVGPVHRRTARRLLSWEEP